MNTIMFPSVPAIRFAVARLLAGATLILPCGVGTLSAAAEPAQAMGTAPLNPGGAVSFPVTTVGTAAAQVPVTFSIDTSATLGATLVLTQGGPNLDFTLGTGSTCTGAVTAGTTCVVDIVFTPKYPGQRMGAVELTNAAGTVIATMLIYGAGTGPQVTYSPGTISTVAGNGVLGYAGDGTAAISAELSLPAGVAVDGAGNLYLADKNNSRIRKVTAVTGLISTVAGNGTAGYGGDGAMATNAELNFPTGVAVDGEGNLYIADQSNHRIRKVTSATGLITTVAGNGMGGYVASQDTGTTSATSAELCFPYAVAVDGAGNLFIADYTNQRIRKVTAVTGLISTVAGNGASGYVASQDTGTMAATSAALQYPQGVAVDGAGNLYIGDSYNQRIRKVTAATGHISTVAGNGTAGFNGDGIAATTAELNYPAGVAVDGAGNVYIADNSNNRIRKLEAVTGIISTVAGNGTANFTGDGTAAPNAELQTPYGLTVDGAGNVYFGDFLSYRIRKVSATAALLSFAATAVGVTSTDSPQTVTVNNIGNSVLTFSNPATGGNPSISTGFSIGNSSTCPQLTSGSSAGTLDAGASCTDILSFTPTVGGSISGQLMTTDDTLNVSPSSQTVSLNGTAIYPTPTVTALSPTSGSTAGGNTVTITGANLSQVTALNFGSVAATSFTVVSNTSITAVAPAESAGAVAVTLSNPGATSAGSIQYTFALLAPVVSSVPPNGGSTAGGDTVTINGANFTGVTSVYFGSAAAASYTVNSASSITAVTPAGVGVVDVVVITAGGASAIGLNDRFTFYVPQSYVVTTLNDDASGVAANCTGSGSSICSLRDAIAAASVAPPGAPIHISFAPATYASASVASPAVYSVAVNGTLNIGGPGTVTITGPVDGAGNNLLALDGGYNHATSSGGVGVISLGGNITLNHLIIQNGNGSVGGIYVADGPFTLSNSLVSGNMGTSAGAIYINGPFLISNSTFTGNSATVAGVGYFSGAKGTVRNSTFSGNSASWVTGGIYVSDGFVSDNYVTLLDSTFSDNSASIVGDMYIGGTVNSYNSILADSVYGTFNSSNNNITSGANLSALGNYGGPTQTMVPLPGSRAICAGAVSIPGVAIPTTDQRGATHSSTYCAAGQIDAGAVQTSYGLGFTTQPSDVAIGAAMSPAPVISLVENGLPTSAASPSITLTDANHALSSNPAAQSSPATFGGLVFNALEGGDALTATASLGIVSGAAPSTLTAASGSFNVYAPPLVTGVSPNGGPVAGGTVITISGANFAPGSTVNFGGVAATNVSVVSATQITATAPAGTGTVDVTVTNLSRAVSAISAPADQFTYYAPQSYIVTTLNDDATGVPGNCTGNSNTCSMRDAIAAATALPKGVSVAVTFAPETYASATANSPAVYSVSTGGTLYFNTGGALLTISGPTDGNGKNLLAIDGGYNVTTQTGGVQVLYVGVGSMTLNHLIVRNGRSSQSFGQGGGIYVSSGTMALNSSLLSGNSAPNYGFGGGMFIGGGTVTVSNSTITGNAAVYGGGIEIESGKLTVINSTLSGNSGGLATGNGAGGGGVLADGGTVTILNSTLAGNTARHGSGGGIWVNSGGVSLYNSIVAGNAGAFGSDDIYAAYYNYVNGGGNILNSATPMLAPLGDYGGTTQTMVPLSGSPAICAGIAAISGVAVPTTDQRGVSHSSAYCAAGQIDAGAVQTNYAVAFATQPSNTGIGSAIAPAPVVLITESGSPLSGGSASVSISDSVGGLTGTTSANPTSSSASFTNLVPTVSGPQTLRATLPLNNAIALSLSATSSSFSVSQPVLPVITVSPVTIPYPTQGTIALQANIGYTGNTAPTGAVTFSIDGGVPVPATGCFGSSPLTCVTAYPQISLNAGAHTITATIAATTGFLTTTGTATLTVTSSPQVIVLTTPPPTPDVAGNTVQLSSASGGASGNPVVFSVLSGPAWLAADGITLTYTGAGTVVIAADQAASADGNYSAAAEVTSTVIVGPVAVAYNAGTVAVASQSGALTATLNFPNGGTLGSMSYLTQGAPNLDFIGCTSGAQTKQPANPKDGTPRQITFSCPSLKSKGGAVIPVCSIGTTYSAGQICTVSYIFQPSNPGQRLGALSAVDNNGKPMGTSYLRGLGTGPLVVITPGTVSTVAGNGLYGYNGDNIAATTAELYNPHAVAVDGAGNLFIADGYNSRVRRVDAVTGNITTVAGNGIFGYGNGDGGPATSADVAPSGVALDGAGNFYIADYSRIRKVDAVTGIINSVVTGLSGPGGVTVDGSGNLYIADTGNNRIRRMDAATGNVTTVAGNGTGGYGGDGSLAATAQLYNPNRVALDSTGNLYIADTSNQRIRRVDASTGIITTVVAGLSYPLDATLDAAGNLYIADTYDSEIRRVDAITGIISTVMGNGSAGFGGDGGTATNAELNSPQGVAFDAAGNLYIVDSSNQRIRKVTATASLQSFADTNVGSISTDSPKTITISNSGYDPAGTNPLTFSGVSGPSSASFALDPMTTCWTGTSLQAGQSCVLAVDFAPKTTGAPLTDAVTLADNNLNNISPATSSQNVPLSGNALQQTPGVSVSAASIVYGTPTVTLSATISFVGSIAPTGAVTFSIDGSTAVVAVCMGSTSPFTCTASYSSGAFGVPTHTITASIAPTPGFLAANATAAFTVTPAPLTATAGSYTGVYDGNTHVLSACVVSSNPDGLICGNNPTGPVGPDTGGAAVIPILSGSTSNYAVTVNKGSWSITPLAVTVTAGSYSATYDGIAHTPSPCTSTYAGVTCTNGPASVGPSISAPAPVSPIVTIATGTPSDYSITKMNGTFGITRATAVITPAAAAKVYGTSDPSLSGTASGFVPADAIVVAYSRTVGQSVAGSPYTISAAVVPNPALSNYNVTYNTAPFSITKAPASVTPSAANKTYGTADPILTGTLAGFLPADGVSATYSRTPGETVNGSPYIISATLLPTAALSNYAITYNTGPFTVSKARPIVRWTAPAPITYGTALSALQLNANANVPGTFSYTPSTGTILAGGTQTLSAIFTPTDVADYNTATAAISILVTASTVTTGVASGTQTYPAWNSFAMGPVSTGYPYATGKVMLYNNGVAVTTLPLGPDGKAFYTTQPPLSVGVNNLTVYYTGDANNPPGSSAVTTITVLPAPVNFSASCQGAVTYGQTYACQVFLTAGTSTPPTGIVTYIYDGGSPVAVPITTGGTAPFTVPGIPDARSHTVAIGYAGQGNYSAAPTLSKTFTTQPGQTVLKVSASSSAIAYGSSVMLSGTATAPISGVPFGGIVTFYDGNVAIGTGTIAINGAISITITNVQKGVHSYYAKFPGTGNFVAATSSSITVTAH